MHNAMWRAAWHRCARAAGMASCGLLLLLLMAACGGRPVPIGVRGYVHDDADDAVWSFKVNGVAGTLPDPGGRPGKVACCVNLPAEWTPGLTARVELWHGPRHRPSHTVLAVPVEEYRGPTRGTLQVHVYPGGRVRVVVSRFAPGHPRYPLLEGVALDWALYHSYCAFRPSDGVCQVRPGQGAP